MSDYTPTTSGTGLPLFDLCGAPPADRKRLEGQCGVILDMLRERPRTNDELSHVARKHTSRLSDIRKAGYTIECERLEGGLTRYTLTD